MLETNATQEVNHLVLAMFLKTCMKLLHDKKEVEGLMSTSIATRMLQLLGIPTLLYQPEVRTNLEVTVLYT